jgi:proteasome accessory factor B
MPTISKTQRWLDLISYLVGRRYPVAVGELMEKLPGYARHEAATALRYLERDKAELLALGVPIEYVRGDGRTESAELQGYRLRSHDFFLPYLRIVADAAEPRSTEGVLGAGTVALAAEDAAAVVEALQRVAGLPSGAFAAEARVAYAKLVLDLDTSALAGAPVHVAEAPSNAVHRATLNALSDALVERRTVRIRYRAAGGAAAADRTVDPYGLLANGGRWYLVAHCHARGEPREFRVDRIESVDVGRDDGAGAAPSFSVPPDFSIAAYAHRQAWELGGETVTEARVRFRFPWSLWAERNGYGEAEADEPDGAAVRRFQLLATGPFLRWLLSTEAEVELLGPPEMVAELRALAADVAAIHDTEA